MKSSVRELDLCGLKCPLPALYARRTLAGMAPGATLRVLCTDPMAAIDIPHMAHETGCRVAATAQDGARLSFDIVRGEDAAPVPNPV